MIFLGNLGGTLCLDKMELIHFKFKSDRLVNSQIVTKVGLPYEFASGECNSHLLHCFFNARIAPKSQFKLDKKLIDAGIRYYIPERIIRFQYGQSTIDRYWLAPDNDATCWSDEYFDYLCNIIGKKEIVL